MKTSKSLRVVTGFQWSLDCVERTARTRHMVRDFFLPLVNWSMRVLQSIQEATVPRKSRTGILKLLLLKTFPSPRISRHISLQVP